MDTHKDLWIEANNVFKDILLKMDCITSTHFLISPLLLEVQSFKYYCLLPRVFGKQPVFAASSCFFLISP